MGVRKPLRVVEARSTRDGAGVRLRRAIPTSELDHLDPFLLLDEFKSKSPDDVGAGFPDHPHRGFETVTYMLAGRMRHRDHAGHEGLILPGGAQWMTAGRGIVHSEMPEPEDGHLWGFQLWVNLPAELELREPSYQDIAPEAIPEADLDGARIRLIAGALEGFEGPVRGIATDPLLADLRLSPAARISIDLSARSTAFLYGFQGELDLAGTRLGPGHLGVLGSGERLEISGSDRGGCALLAAAKPIGQPIVRHGPFVLSSRERLLDALRDLQAGRFG